MKGVLVFVLLALAVFALAFGGYVDSSDNNSGSDEVTLVITTLGKTLTEVVFADGKTAVELLRKKHEVSLLSDYVKCIDSVCSGKEYFWTYYVNGKLFPGSAVKHKPLPGDIIEIRFTNLGG